jgi:hypothetical protein
LKRIERGDYFFASSHIPLWRLRIPPATFTITILRDPLSRAISYYRYLLWARSCKKAGESGPLGDPRERGYSGFPPMSLAAEVEHVASEGAFLDGGARNALGQLSIQNLRFERSAIRAFGLGGFLARLAPRRRERAFRTFLARVPPRHLFTQLHMFSERFDPSEAAENALACSAVCLTESLSKDFGTLSHVLGLDLKPQHERRYGNKMELETPELELLRERLIPEYEMFDHVRRGISQHSGPPRG